MTKGAAEMFISESEYKYKSLQCNVRNIKKTTMRKKASFKRLSDSYEFVVNYSSFFYYLLINLFVSRDSTSLILEENNSMSVF